MYLISLTGIILMYVFFTSVSNNVETQLAVVNNIVTTFREMVGVD